LLCSQLLCLLLLCNPLLCLLLLLLLLLLLMCLLCCQHQALLCLCSQLLCLLLLCCPLLCWLHSGSTGLARSWSLDRWLLTWRDFFSGLRLLPTGRDTLRRWLHSWLRSWLRSWLGSQKIHKLEGSHRARQFAGGRSRRACSRASRIGVCFVESHSSLPQLEKK
jgi:hypothetical protein